jgi:hypothetical protein
LPRIKEEIPYNGAYERIERLGLSPILDELRRTITGFKLLVKEEKDANGGKAVRELIDKQFASVGGWEKGGSGEIDWLKCRTINGTRVCLGVEVQFSARSDLMVMDVIHLRRAISTGRVDVGVIVAPTDRLSEFLTDRGPSISAAKIHVKEARAEDLPLILISLEHDGTGPPLAKQAKRGKS